MTATEAAYRVVQEALTNALTHAPGAQVSVTVFEHNSKTLPTSSVRSAYW